MKVLANSEFEKEVKGKWGQTQAYREYKERHHDRQKWDDIAEGMDQIMAEFAESMKKGEKPDSVHAQSLVKILQDHITENYYHCTDEILAGLGQMYVADERFKNNIDKYADGTATFIREAIAAYCRK